MEIGEIEEDVLCSAMGKVIGAHETRLFLELIFDLSTKPFKQQLDHSPHLHLCISHSSHSFHGLSNIPNLPVRRRDRAVLYGSGSS